MQKDGDPGRQPGKRLASGKQDKPPKEPKPKKPGRLTRQQKFLIALAAVLAVGVVGVAAWQSLFVRPDLSAEKEPPVTVDPDTGETEEVEEIDWGEGTRPRSEGERKSEDYYTVLILGRDTGGGGNTDTMLLASYDVTNQKATVMSIPRDTMVNVPWDIKKINSVYNYYGGGDRGIQYLYKEISQLVGFEPDFQVIVEWEAVGEIVDAMGGVWFDVPRNMDYEDPYQDLSIHLKKGYQLLDGEQAMGVVRFRDGANGYKDGDIGRIGTQQAFLKAVLEQPFEAGEYHQDQPAGGGVPEERHHRSEPPEHLLVCQGGHSGRAEGRERELRHHARQLQRLRVQPFRQQNAG